MRTKLTVAAMAVFGMVLAGSPAFAQEATVNIPFAFTVMGKTLPAGVYEFSEPSQDVVKLQSLGSPGIQVMVPVLDRLDATSDTGSARIVFNKDGRTDVLAQVWLDGDDGFALFAPKQ